MGTLFSTTYICRLIELLCSDAQRSCRLQIPLSLGKLGCRHHLHGLCDLLDVLDRLQSHGNELQVRHLGLFVRWYLENKMLEAALTTSEMAAVNKVWFGNVLSEIFMCQLTTMAVMMVNFYTSSFFNTISAQFN